MKKIWQWLAAALLVAIFLSLANWHWNRAAEVKHPVKIDQTVLPIDSVISPKQSITQAQVGRKVSVTGHYVSIWQAPHQDKNQTWDVGLFQTKDNAMILIVRGLHKDISLNNEEVTVTGHLVPPQSSDVAESSGNQISRVDSALFVSKTDLPLYQSFIQATSEEPNSGYQIIPFVMNKGVPGFYWQHISYVVIWFLFAITVIYLMLYQRRLDKVAP